MLMSRFSSFPLPPLRARAALFFFFSFATTKDPLLLPPFPSRTTLVSLVRRTQRGSLCGSWHAGPTSLCHPPVSELSSDFEIQRDTYPRLRRCTLHARCIPLRNSGEISSGPSRILIAIRD